MWLLSIKTGHPAGEGVAVEDLAVAVQGVGLEYKGRLTCTYPAPDPDCTWRVTARPDGTLTDRQGREYSYLFWEGVSDGNPPDFSRGFVVKGSDTAAFLHDAQKTFTPLCPDELPVNEGHLIVEELNAQAALADLRVMTKDAHHAAAKWLVDNSVDMLDRRAHV